MEVVAVKETDKASEEVETTRQDVTCRQRRLKVVLDGVNHQNVGVLEKITKICLQTALGTTFRDEVIKFKEFAQFSHLNNNPVGGVSCRLEEPSAAPVMPQPLGGSAVTAVGGTARPCRRRLYIMTLCVLPPYRRYGIGSELLRWVLEAARKPIVGVRRTGRGAAVNNTIQEVYLHLWTGNEAGRKFYKAHGFEVAGEVEDYFPHLQPSTAQVMLFNLVTTTP